MNELALVVIGGLLGSSHCIGMCGGFALTIGIGSRSPWRNAARQLVYSAGRVFTYGFLGLSAGFGGYWLAGRTRDLLAISSWLSLMAGAILIVQGLATLGLLMPARWRRPLGGSKAACIASSFARPFLRSDRWESVFVAGMLNGLLPCGLVYGYLTLASSTASLPLGLATMVAFGLGTVPAMLLTGVGASLLSLTTRRRMFQLAGVCVIITGLISFQRGLDSLGVRGSRGGDCHPHQIHDSLNDLSPSTAGAE